MENNLRAHRRRCGLSQRDLAQLVGYLREWQISRHERSEASPPLHIALAYEVIFGIPVSKLFRGIHAKVTEEVRSKIYGMQRDAEQSTRAPSTKATQRKQQWLNQHELV